MTPNDELVALLERLYLPADDDEKAVKALLTRLRSSGPDGVRVMPLHGKIITRPRAARCSHGTALCRRRRR